MVLQQVLYMIDTKTPNRLRYAEVQVLHQNGQVIEVSYKKKALKYKIWKEKIDYRPEIIDSKQLETRITIKDRKSSKPGKYHPWR